ncbi:MAG: dehydrogenase, partial [Saprospiraceae bacterium]|nr:dehydrogenase [Saprospiraceae bacterium]
MSGKINRRSFVERTALAGTGVVISPFISSAAGFFNSVDDTIKIALVGCGGRGTGAASQALSTKQNVKLVAMADAFKDNLEASLTNIINEVGKDKVDVPKDRQYVGFDGYLHAIQHA